MGWKVYFLVCRSPPLSSTTYFTKPDDLFTTACIRYDAELQFADVAEIQGAVTNELKKVQKEEFSPAFQKLYDRAKVCIYANGT
jgi:hypothetical protein